MNCYYSNLIEGHDTHPREIDRALADDFSTEPGKRALQHEAVAHIKLQTKIDQNLDPAADPTSAEYIFWLHEEFCKNLPEEFLSVENPDTREIVRVEPGKFRNCFVQVGAHIPPPPETLPELVERFGRAYESERLSKLQQILAVAAAHHRLLWIHPFVDGNGRVARLMSHSMLKRIGVGDSLWSASRGLARGVGRYKRLLMTADEPRRGDLDGRGSLSEQAFAAFTEFFLTVCVDQVQFMESLLEPSEMLRRIELYVQDEVAAGRLLKGSFALLREAVLAGSVGRGRATELTGYRDRKARDVLYTLTNRGLLVPTGARRGSLRLGFPVESIERWFPRLYPVSE
jgi:Fic family protein